MVLPRWNRSAFTGAMLLLTALPAGAATNLVSNPGFATSLSTWSPVNIASLGTAWSSLDANGSPTSGSIQITNRSSQPDDMSIAASQCLAVNPGGTYVVGGDLFLPSGQTQTYGPQVFFEFFKDPGCTTFAYGVGYGVEEAGRWIHRASGAIVLAADVHSVRVELWVSKHLASDVIVGNVDNVFVKPTACVPTETSSCVDEGRFRVTATYRTGGGLTGTAHTYLLASDTAVFWFFADSNIEMIVKVLNGCPVNDRFWVYAGGTTNVRVDLTVTDTETNATHTYVNPLNTNFKMIADTSTFGACP